MAIKWSPHLKYYENKIFIHINFNHNLKHILPFFIIIFFYCNIQRITTCDFSKLHMWFSFLICVLRRTSLHYSFCTKFMSITRDMVEVTCLFSKLWYEFYLHKYECKTKKKEKWFTFFRSYPNLFCAGKIKWNLKIKQVAFCSIYEYSLHKKYF